MLSAGRRRLCRDALCVATGLVAALCFAGPISELNPAVPSDGPDAPYALATRVYHRSRNYGDERVGSTLWPAEHGEVIIPEPCAAALGSRMTFADDNPEGFAFEAVWRWKRQRQLDAFETPALDALAKRSPLLLQALDGCLSASLLRSICGRYVTSIAAAARDGRGEDIHRAQEAIAHTAEAAYCLVRRPTTVNAPPRAR